ncbi:hypothetical protein D5086_029290 [Populus alba]|uniref:Uncharacterized protein n=1 Tax=Populus alba TaxID=43335 RepID=A0ACC4AT85_POPAL
MKKIDMFCASQASTAICMSMDRPSSSSSTIQPGGPTIDRCNPVIREQKRIPRTRPLVPCTSQPPPINPVPYQLLHKSQKSTSKNKASDQNSNKKSNSTKPKPKPNDQKNKKISFKPADIDDGDKKSAASLNVSKYIVRKSWAKPGGSIIAPPGSSRNLLGDAAFVDGIPDYDPVSAQLVPVEPNMSTQALSKEESTASRPSSSSSPNQRASDMMDLFPAKPAINSSVSDDSSKAPPLAAPLLFFENPTLLDPTPSPSLPWSIVSTRDLRAIIDGLHSWAHQPLDSQWFIVNKAESMGLLRVEPKDIKFLLSLDN